jgi:hypothetical protein
MKVLGINSIFKEDSSLYYMNHYTANAVIELITQKVDLPVNFSVEITPLGTRNIDVNFNKDDINYPVMPLTKALKTFVDELSKNGELP